MFTIIIPIYNAAKFLKTCIDSVLSQTYHNFELLLIDDGSTDDSYTICDHYSEQDSRVKVFHKINQGVGLSRNIGLMNAQHEWILFIDADDYIDKDYLLTISEILTAHNQSIDILVFPTIKEKPLYNKREYIDNVFTTPNIHDSKTILESTLMFFKMSASIYSKVYKRSIIQEHNILFRDSSIFEDGMFNLEYFKNINRVYYHNKAFYHYIIYPDQTSLSRIPLKPFIEYYNTAKILYPLITEISKLKGIDVDISKCALIISNRILSIGFYAIYKEHNNYHERKLHIERYSKVFKTYSNYYSNIKYSIFKVTSQRYIPFILKNLILKHMYKSHIASCYKK